MSGAIWMIRKWKVCLLAHFFFSWDVYAQDEFSPALKPIYEEVLHFQFERWPIVPELDGYAPEEKAQAAYLNSLAGLLHFLIKHSDPASDLRESYIESIEDCDSKLCQFYLSELYFHSSILHFLKGDPFKAFFQFRKCYRTNKKALQKAPIEAQFKTAGALNIILSAIPDSYSWLTGLLGFDSDYDLGVSYLEKVRRSGSDFSFEAHLILILYKHYLFDRKQVAEFQQLIKTHPASPFITYLFNDMALRNHMSEQVIDLRANHEICTFQVGEAHLNQLRYDSALYYFEAYESRATRLTSQNLYKLWLVHELFMNKATAERYRTKLQQRSKSVSDEERYAYFKAISDQPLNHELMKIRLTTDGGFFDLAHKLSINTDTSTWPSEKDKTEWIYRSARLAHLTQKDQTAIQLYTHVVNRSPGRGWYFAANSAYELGNLYHDNGLFEAAKAAYSRVFEFSDYPYESGLRRKAKGKLKALSHNEY